MYVLPQFGTIQTSDTQHFPRIAAIVKIGGANVSCTNLLCKMQKCSASMRAMKAKTISECAVLVSQNVECGLDFTFNAKDGACACTPRGLACKRETKANSASYRLQGIPDHSLHHCTKQCATISLESARQLTQSLLFEMFHDRPRAFVAVSKLSALYCAFEAA